MDRKLYDVFKKTQNYHWWYKGRRQIIIDLLDQYLDANSAVRRILELGCGVGSMLDALSKYGEVSGMDYDQDSVNYCCETLNYDVRQGSLPNHVPFNDRYDVIACFDVLEHIDEDQESLRTIQSYLKNEDSIVFITVPAYMFLWGGNDDLSFHKRRYTKKELIEKAQNAQIEILKCSYFNTWLFPCCFVVRKLKRLLHLEKPDLEINSHDGIINRLLYNIFYSESYFLRKRNLPFGVSILLIGRTGQKSILQKEG